MNINENIITDEEIISIHVEASPDSLVGTPVTQIKQIFDKLPKLVAKKHNELIESLTLGFGASFIGTVRNGVKSNVQSELDFLHNEILKLKEGGR